jgi:hypothetical protein
VSETRDLCRAAKARLEIKFVSSTRRGIQN